VSEDGSALAALEALGVMTTPVIVLGSEVVVGFDRERLSSLLLDKEA